MVRRAFLGLLAAPVVALAHHGLAEFDQSSRIALHGVVAEFHYTNPHCVVEFDVKGADGRVTRWQGQLTSPLHLKGWTAASLEPGIIVDITGYRAKSGAPYMWITTLVSSNGLEVGTGSRKAAPNTP